MKVVLNEIWQSWRASLRRPGFLLLATGVLALGIGASVAVFTLIENTLLQPLPFPQAQRVVALDPSHGRDVSPQQFRRMQPLEGVASMGLVMDGTRAVNVDGAGAPVLAHGARMSRGVLQTLGTSVMLGRDFDTQEHALHGPRAVLLAHGFWLRRYGGDRSVVGKRMLVEGVPHTIVGVLPANFTTVNAADIMLPLRAGGESVSGRFVALAQLDGRRDAAAVAAQATARLTSSKSPLSNPAVRSARVRIVAKNPRAALAGNDAATLGLFQACGLLVLLIALVNLVNLMVIRAVSSSHSLAVRGALGASGLRIALPVLAEGLLVGITGSIAGVVFGRAGLGLLQHVIPIAWLGHADLQVGAVVWLWSVSVGISMSVLAAWLGQHRARRLGEMDELREGAHSSMGVRAGRFSRSLVVGQVILATVLLAATAMLGHVVVAEGGASLGFNADHVLTFSIKPIASGHADAVSVQTLQQHLVTRLREMPGVEDATVATGLPVGLSSSYQLIQTDGSALNVQLRGVGAGYFHTFRIPLVAGRAFNRSDLEGGARVAVINRTLATRRYGGRALGQLAGSGASAFRIIGVVGDTRHFGMLPSGQLYVPRSQYPTAVAHLLNDSAGMLAVALRVHGAPDGYRQAVREAVADVMPGQPVASMRSMRQVIHERTRGSRSALLLIGLLTGMALLLAAIGLYAVMTSTVVARKREFSIRVALGASASRLIRLVLQGGMRQIAAGLVVGLVIAVSVCMALRGLFVLLGRSAIDPGALVLTCALMAIAGLLACLLPALRAARVQPMHALKGE